MRKVLLLSAIRLVRGDQAALDEILRALRKTSGNMRQACEQLGLGKSSMYRLIDELGAREAVDALIESKGYKVKGRDKDRAVEPARRKRIEDEVGAASRRKRKASVTTLKTKPEHEPVAAQGPRARVKKASA